MLFLPSENAQNSPKNGLWGCLCCVFFCIFSHPQECGTRETGKLNSSSEGFSGSDRRQPLRSMVKSSVENGDDKALSIFTYSSLLNAAKLSSGYRLMYSLNANVSESDSAMGQYAKVKFLLFLKSLRRLSRRNSRLICACRFSQTRILYTWNGATCVSLPLSFPVAMTDTSPCRLAPFHCLHG